MKLIPKWARFSRRLQAQPEPILALGQLAVQGAHPGPKPRIKNGGSICAIQKVGSLAGPFIFSDEEDSTSLVARLLLSRLRERILVVSANARGRPRGSWLSRGRPRLRDFP